MAVRRESVRLELDDAFTGPTIKAAAAARLLQGALDGTRGSSDNLNPSLTQTERAVSDVGSSSRRVSGDINQFSGRLGLAAQAVASFGPAFAPIAAVAVPAVTALAGALGVAALAGGTAVLAFQGVGDALSKLNTAQVDPTAAHIKAAHLAFDAISPSARQFVRELDKMGPSLAGLKAAAGSDMFPGLTAGLKGALTELPRAKELFKAVGGAIGNLGEMTGDSLASGKWSEFLDFLTTTAPPAIESLGRTVGNLASGLADLWMAFDPLNTSVIGMLENGSQAFQDWADSLGQTEGFQEFVDYIRTAGPEVGDALAQVGNAFLQIVEAAAPIGGPVLQVVESLARAIATIADSPIGTPLFGAVAAISALSLATRGYDSIRKTALGAPAVNGIRSITAELRTATTMQERMSAVTSTAGRNFGKQSLLLGGLALASSGVADKVGLSNAASLALAGSLAGPVGTALGAATGLTMDLAHSTDDLSAALDGAANSSGDSLVDLASKQNDLVRSFTGLSNIGRTFAFLGGDFEKFKSEVGDLQVQIDSLQNGNVNGQAALGALLGPGIGVTGPIDDATQATEQLSLAALDAAAAEKNVAKALQDSRKAAADTGRQFFNLGDSLDDSKVSLDGWIADMQKQAAALRDFQHNAQQAADKGLRKGLIKALEEAGPAGALRMAQLADGTKEQIGRANRAWKGGAQAIKDYTNVVGGVPKAKATTFTAKTTQALSKLSELTSRRDALKDKSFNVTALTTSAQRALAAIVAYRIPDKSFTVTQHTNATLGEAARATGGYISGPGTATSDSIPARLSNGEYVVQAKAVDRYGVAMFDAINAQRFASGGKVGPKRSHAQLVDVSDGTRSGIDVTHGLRGMKRDLADLEHALKRSTNAVEGQTDAVDRETAARDDLVSQFASLASDIAGQFQSNLFEPMSDVFGSNSTMSDPIGVLMGDLANSAEFAALFAGLQSRGLSGDALTAAAQGGTAALQTVGAYSDADLARYADLYAQREAQNASVGQQVATAQFGAALALSNAQLDEANGYLWALVQKQDQQQAATTAQTRAVQQVEAATRDNGHAVARGRRSRKG
jgi:hypothetical protein